jgi:hypothetical protein
MRNTFLAAARLLSGAVGMMTLAACANLYFERVDYKAYPTAENPGDFYGRVYTRTRIEDYKMKAATSTREASQLVGFPVHLPTYLPEGFAPVAKFVTLQSHAYQIIVDPETARSLLQSAGISTDSLPTALERLQVDALASPSATAFQRSDTHFVTFIQSRNPSFNLPSEADLALLEELGMLSWQYLGLTRAQAVQLSQSMNWASFLALPPSDMETAEMIDVGGQTGVAMQSGDLDIQVQAIFWEADGVLYGLYSNLPLSELRLIAESLE